MRQANSNDFENNVKKLFSEKIFAVSEKVSTFALAKAKESH